MDKIEKMKNIIEYLNIQTKLYDSDLKVLNTIIYEILECQLHVYNGEEYIKMNDVVKICKDRFKLLSSEIKKEME